MTAHQDTAAALTAKAAPAVAVTGASLMGVGLQDWVYGLTIVYLLLQIVWFVLSKARKGRRDE